jgi:hypothetical protein
MVAQNALRKSGMTTGEEATDAAALEAAQQLDVQLPDERARKFRTPGFARMHTAWQGEDAMVINRVHALVQQRIFDEFDDLHTVLYDLFDIVRTKALDPVTQRPKLDADGLPLWRRKPNGDFEEDWSRLTSKQRETALFTITTRLVAWSEMATRAWAEAMFAKVKWEETYAEGFEADPNPRATIPTREAQAQLAGSEDKYFAVYVTYYSRRAESLVRYMELLGQRLKDVYAPNGGR